MRARADQSVPDGGELIRGHRDLKDEGSAVTGARDFDRHTGDDAFHRVVGHGRDR